MWLSYKILQWVHPGRQTCVCDNKLWGVGWGRGTQDGSCNNKNSNLNVVSDLDSNSSKAASKWWQQTTFFDGEQRLSENYPPTDYQCQSYEKAPSLIQWQSQQNHWASNNRTECHQKFKCSYWFSYSDNQHQACRWRIQDLHQCLELSQCKLLCKMARKNKKDFFNINKQQVWCKTSKSLMPPNQECVKKVGLQDQMQQCVPGASHCTWVRHLPGINFSENCSQVINNITSCILLLMLRHFGHLAKIVDAETAFLYGNLEEEIYIELPQGMSNVKRMIASF